MKQKDILHCQIQEWYPRFERISLKSKIIPLPKEFVSYLLEDGVYLHEDSEAIPRRPKLGEWEAHQEDYKGWDETEDEEEEPQVPTFPALEDAIRTAIEALGGEVLPKLNWSCPKDVGWLSPSGSAKCRNPGEVMLLLKSSDTIGAEDATLTRPPQYVLALRQWYDLKPDMELRCFVRHHRLIGVSQREVTSHYAGLVERREELRAAVLAFFRAHIRHKFAPADYTFDVYVTRGGRVKLVDFNPYGGSTLPLLFTWEELEALHLQHSPGASEQQESVEEEEEEREQEQARAASASGARGPLDGGGEDVSDGRAAAEQSSSGCFGDGANQAGAAGETEEGRDGDGEGHRSCGGDGASSTAGAAAAASDAAASVAASPLQKMRNLSRGGHTGTGAGRGGGGGDGGQETENSASANAGLEGPSLGRSGPSSRGSGRTVEEEEEHEDCVEFRVVTSPSRVQPALRMASGVPLDLFDTAAGSAIDEFLQRANLEAEAEAEAEANAEANALQRQEE
eukprot:jgi/Mesen1/10777/ME000091S10313